MGREELTKGSSAEEERAVRVASKLGHDGQEGGKQLRRERLLVSSLLRSVLHAARSHPLPPPEPAVPSQVPLSLLSPRQPSPPPPRLRSTTPHAN